jgi:serine/threonine protein phosphatase PrpC
MDRKLSSEFERSEAPLLLSSSKESYCSKYLITIGNPYLDFEHEKAKIEGEVELPSLSIMHALFLIVASDGLWDVMNSYEATELVCEFLLTQIVKPTVQLSRENVSDYGVLLLPEAMQNAAKLLALEAFVRGSMDNVGVCVVDLL